jgi:hypothetical protein
VVLSPRNVLAAIEMSNAGMTDRIQITPPFPWLQTQ